MNDYLKAYNNRQKVMGRINGEKDDITSQVLEDYNREKRRRKQQVFLEYRKRQNGNP